MNCQEYSRNSERYDYYSCRRCGSTRVGRYDDLCGSCRTMKYGNGSSSYWDLSDEEKERFIRKWKCPECLTKGGFEGILSIWCCGKSILIICKTYEEEYTCPTCHTLHEASSEYKLCEDCTPEKSQIWALPVNKRPPMVLTA